MSVTESILTGIRNVLRQQDKIVALTEAVKQLSSEMRELDRRVVRIETMIELAQSQAVPRLSQRTKGSRAGLRFRAKLLCVARR